MREGISFLLGREERHLKAVDPTLTVLRYLREVEHRTGTKEGCAEGDCGACTVVIGEAGDDGMTYKAVNACIQFLPSLDGKQLLSVEDVAEADGTLHPVQERLCAANASQCGYCTPGFVMSLYAQYANGARPGRAEWKDVLAGNLCRCTGYGPILDAALAARPGDDGAGRPADASAELRTLQLTGSATVSSDDAAAFSPSCADELAALYEAHPDAVIVGGATDVGLWVTKQHRHLAELIFLDKVADLAGIDDDGTTVEIGAAVTLAQAHETLARLAPDLGELVRRFASLQIRNVATVCGNIANGSPIGDLAPALIALEAELVLRKGDDRRAIALEDYFIAYGEQDRQPGEFVERVRIPHPAETRAFRCYKLSKRFDQDISAVCGAFAVTLQDGIAANPRVAFGGMAATPARASATEAALDGAAWTEDTVRAAADKFGEDFEPLTDMRATAEYRLLAARNLLVKFLVETVDPKAATRVLEVAP